MSLPPIAGYSVQSQIIMPDFMNIVPALQSVMEASIRTLAMLNRQHGTNIALKFVPVAYLKMNPHLLKETYMGFVIREQPFEMYIVPENIHTIEEAEKTTKHEFKHILDLTCDPNVDGDCPVNLTSKQREQRANSYEAVPVYARPSEVFAKDQDPVLWGHPVECTDGICGIDNPAPEVLPSDAAAAPTTTKPCSACQAVKAVKGEIYIRKKVLEVMREMGMAGMHLVGLRNDLAVKIREMRKKLEDVLWPGPTLIGKELPEAIEQTSPPNPLRTPAELPHTHDKVVGGLEKCSFCAIKHMMNAKTFLIEAEEKGFVSPISIEEIDEIVGELDAFNRQHNLRPAS
jgi:hypothetical protein